MGFLANPLKKQQTVIWTAEALPPHGGVAVYKLTPK